MRKYFTKAIAGTLAVVLMVSGITISGINKIATVSAADDEYSLVWSDEFDGDSLNRDNWNVEVNGNGGGNNELQYYRDNTENISVSDGTLKITAKKESYLGKQYTSGRITTQGKKSFKYGKIEARIKLPRLNGIWPAFWMLGENISTVSWPACGEMDIMEAINNDNNVYANLHWRGDGRQVDTSGRAKDVGDRTDWHVYGMEWDANWAKFYVDGVVFEKYYISSVGNLMDEFRKKQFIILNVAVGGVWPFSAGVSSVDDSKLPATMEVDYVRVYQKPEVSESYDGPMIEVTEDAVAVATKEWTSWFGGKGWQGSTGTITPNGDKPADGVTVNLTSVGTDVGNDSEWGAQAQLLGLHYYKASTYTYNCTLLSDVDKRIYVKIADSDEAPLVGEWVNLKAGVEYNFSKQFIIDSDYEGEISIKFGLGKNSGDTIEDKGKATIKISNVSLITTTKIPDPDYVKNQQTTTAVENQTNVAETVTAPGEGSAKDKVTVAKTKIKKATRSKNGKKVTLKFKKVTGATGYKIKISTSKKFSKKKTKTYDSKKTTKVIKRLKANKKYYVKVMAYAKTNAGVVNGKWSKVKKIKIKK